MSLITSCPACGTMFKVVPDQLRISEGWVRCGHCAEIFDAQGLMVRNEEVQVVPAPDATSVPVPAASLTEMPVASSPQPSKNPVSAPWAPDDGPSVSGEEDAPPA